MSRVLSQRERVLRKARSIEGVCAADFAAPNVCDDGPPIMRVPARIFELSEEGYSFEVVGWRGKTKAWRVVVVEQDAAGSPQAAHLPEPAGRVLLNAEPDMLFGLPRVRGKYGWADQEDAAA